MTDLLTLKIFLAFFRLSLISFGGLFGLLPEMERVLVAQHHWLTHEEFMQSYVMAQFVPGPNMVMCSMIGYKIHGWLGFVAGLVGIYLAPLAMMGVAFVLYHRFRNVTLVRRAELALRPLVFGLLASSAVQLWWAQSQTLVGSTALSVPFAILLTVGGLFALRRKLLGPTQLLLVLGAGCWGLNAVLA